MELWKVVELGANMERREGRGAREVTGNGLVGYLGELVEPWDVGVAGEMWEVEECRGTLECRGCRGPVEVRGIK